MYVSLVTKSKNYYESLFVRSKMLTGQSEYSMSLRVSSAQKEHSGRYSCVSPAGQSHDVILHVHTGIKEVYSTTYMNIVYRLAIKRLKPTEIDR